MAEYVTTTFADKKKKDIKPKTVNSEIVVLDDNMLGKHRPSLYCMMRVSVLAPCTKIGIRAEPGLHPPEVFRRHNN